MATEASSEAPSREVAALNEILGESNTPVEAVEMEDESEEEESEEEETEEEESEEESEDEGEEDSEVESEEEEAEEDSELRIPVYSDRLREQFPDREFNTNEDYEAATAELLEEQATQIQAEYDANEMMVNAWNENPRILRINQLMLQGYPESVAVAMAGFTADDLAEIDMDDPKLQEKFIEAKLSNKKAREEAKKQKAIIEANSKKTKEVVDTWKGSRKLPDSKFKEFESKVEGFIKRFIEVDMDTDMLDLLYNGFYAKTLQANAEDKGRVAGRNEKIKVDKSKKNGDGLPKLNSAQIAPATKKVKYADDFVRALDEAAKRQ